MTRPAAETVAFVVSDVAHVTVAPAIVLSFASFTVAVIVSVVGFPSRSLNDEKLTLSVDSVTDDTA